MNQKLFLSLYLLAFSLSYSIAQVRILENKGQYPDKFKFIGNIPGGRVFLTESQLTYDFIEYNFHKHYNEPGVNNTGNEAVQEVVRAHSYNIRFINSNPNVRIEGNNPSTTSYNYFVGDKRQWAQKVKEFDEIIYSELFEGIDFKYYKYGETVKYDFIVHPDGNPGKIALDVEGVDEAFIDELGNLNLNTSINSVQETKPIAYQIINGDKTYVDCNFHLYNNSLSFQIGEYDPCEILIIDPTLIFSTYSGSTADNWGNTATYDDHGNVYSGGITNNYSGGFFPTTTGAYQVNSGGLWDVAILKYDSLGMSLKYSTYLGGFDSEIPQSLIVNENDELLIMGVTGSSNFPVQSGYQMTFGGGSYSVPFGTAGNNVFFQNGTDIFISKLSESGSDLVSSTFIGGNNNDGIMLRQYPLTKNYGDQSRGDIFIRGNGNILVASKTNSGNFPLENSIQGSYASGYTDAVIFELSPDLNSLLFSTYLGGSGMDAAYTIKENLAGDIVVGGGAEFQDFNLMHSKFSTNGFGDIDGWLAIISNATYQLDTGIYIGTNAYDQLYFTDLDADGNIYTFGQTAGDFPIVGSVFTYGGGQFIQKWNSDLTALLASTKIGSPGDSPDISPTAFLVNDCDNVYLSGWGGTTNSSPYIGGGTSGLPITNDAFQTATFGSDFYLMTLTTDLSTMLYATFLGGDQSSTHVDGGTSRFDKRGIVYHAVCAGCGGVSDFPTTEGVWSNTNNSPNCNNAAFKFDLASLRSRIQTNNVNFNNPNNSHVCYPDQIVFQNRSIGGVLYEWDFGDGTTLTVSDTTAIFHQYQGAGLYKVTLKAIDPNTCIGEDISSVNISVSVPIFDVLDDQTICEGDDIKLVAFGGTTYSWTSTDTTFTSSIRTPEVTPEISTTYYVYMEDELGCFTRDTVQIDVIAAADVNFGLDKTNDCFSRSSINLINQSEGAEEYLWSMGDGQTSDVDRFSYNYESDGEYEVTLAAIKEFCVFEKSEMVKIRTIKVPNVFTPNNSDDYNDVFEIISGSTVDLRIFNRWGRLIFEEEDYQNTWQGLDQPAGMYYYEADIKEELTCKGWVHLLK